MSYVDASKVVRKFERLPVAIRGAVLRTMTKIGYDLTGHIQQDKLQGQVLHHRTGNLSSHVHPQTTDSGNLITTVVGIDSNAVPYAAIHEYGGYIHVPEVSGPLMVFDKGGETIFTRRRAAFTAHMPERSYLRSGLADRKDDYLRDIDAAVGEGTQA
jgi:phage gpG-like protein